MTRFISVLCVLGAAACASHDKEPEMSPASGVATPTARSIDRITAARCEREAHCNNIGSGRKYSSRDDCHSRIKDSAYDSLGPSECTTGIDPAQLNDCLDAIQGEECGDVIDTIERVATCRSAALCAD